MNTAQQTATATSFNHLNLRTAFSTSEAKISAFNENIISLDQIQEAACRIAPFVYHTPTVENKTLSERFNSNFYLKLESLQETGAFKVRGAFNKILTLTDAEKKRGVVAVSGGNHAQAVAYAAQTLGLKSLILMPEYTPEYYLRKTESYGAEVKLFPTMTEAFAEAKKYERAGMTFVHPFDDHFVVAGQGTIGLEILEDVPQVTDVIISIGGGGLAGGVAAAIKNLKPEVKIWGVETNGADSMAQALEAGEIVELEKVTSIAKTLGAPAVGLLGFKLARKYFPDITVVEDAEAIKEMFYLLDRAKILTETATACTLAAAERLRANFSPKSHVVMIACGGNIGLEDLFKLYQSTAE